MIAAIHPASIGRFLLLSSLCLLTGSVQVSRAQDTTAEQSIFVTVRNSITSEEFSRVKGITSAARERYHKAGQKGRLKIIYDFNPDNQRAGSSLFGDCLELASYILSLNDVTTIAYVHKDVSRHTVLPVLACQEIVMAPDDDVHLGNVFPDAEEQPPVDVEQFYKNNRVHFYEEVARRRGRCPAIVLKMLDKNMEVLRGTRPDGSVWYVDRRRQKDENLAAVQPEPVLPAGSAAFYTPKQAQEFGLCRQQLRSRQDVALAYDLPDSSLREDALEGRSPVPWRIEVNGSLNRVSDEAVRRRISRAIGKNANFLIIDLACGGGDPIVASGLGDFLRELKDSTGLHPVMTIAHVTPQAHDTAIFLALGCTEIVIDRGAKLGEFDTYLRERPDAGGIGQALATLAQKRDYPALLLQAMVERDLVVYQVKAKANAHEQRFVTEDELSADQKGERKWVEPVQIKERGKLLTLTAERARNFGLARYQVDNTDQLYERYGLLAGQVRNSGPDWLDQTAEFLRQPLCSVVLVMIGFACLILELKLPGVGLPGVISAICFLLFFWAYMHLAFFWLAMLLFVLGLALIGLEIFVMPGIAVLGASGVLLVLMGLGLATMEKWPQTEYEWEATVITLGRFGLSFVGSVAAAVIIARYLPHIPYANRLVLVPPADRTEEALDTGASVEAVRRAGLLGAIGVAATTLRPSGMVRFGDEFIDVVAEGSYVEPGTRVQVIEIEGNRIVVKEV
jgi:membrane-bound ClpP family serine protease